MTMNAPATRVQLFAVLSLCAIMLIGAGILSAVASLSERAIPSTQAVLQHGIETTWPSESGENRLWTLGGDDFRPWLQSHVAAVSAAQGVLPMKR